MIFYTLIDDLGGGTVGCELSLKAARERAAALGLRRYQICREEVPVTAETMRRVLGGQGGYATRVQIRDYSAGEHL